MAVTSTQRSWERGGCRSSPPPRGRCGGRGLALPWVTPRWEGPCPPPPHSQLCLQNFRVSRLFAHHQNVLFLASKRISLSHQQAGPAHGREESRDGFIRGTRLIPPTLASVEEHISIRWGPAVQFWGARQHLNACLSLCCGPGRKFWRGEGWVGAGLQLQSASETRAAWRWRCVPFCGPAGFL